MAVAVVVDRTERRRRRIVLADMICYEQQRCWLPTRCGKFAGQAARPKKRARRRKRGLYEEACAKVVLLKIVE